MAETDKMIESLESRKRRAENTGHMVNGKTERGDSDRLIEK